MGAKAFTKRPSIIAFYAELIVTLGVRTWLMLGIFAVPPFIAPLLDEWMKKHPKLAWLDSTASRIAGPCVALFVVVGELLWKANKRHLDDLDLIEDLRGTNLEPEYQVLGTLSSAVRGGVSAAFLLEQIAPYLRTGIRDIDNNLYKIVLDKAGYDAASAWCGNKQLRTLLEQEGVIFAEATPGTAERTLRLRELGDRVWMLRRQRERA